MMKIYFLIKKRFRFLRKVKDTDIVSDLNQEQAKELNELSEEDDTKDTETLDEFKKATGKWRTK